MDNITESDLYNVRYAIESDFERLTQWLIQDEVLRYMPFSQEKDVHDFVAIFKLFSRYKAVLTAEMGTHPVAMGALFLMPYMKVSHHAILQFIVDPLWKNKGVGTSMVRNLTHLAKTYYQFEMVHLELFEDSPALSIIKKAGFDLIARQKNHVKREGVYLDKLILQKILKDKHK